MVISLFYVTHPTLYENRSVSKVFLFVNVWTEMLINALTTNVTTPKNGLEPKMMRLMFGGANTGDLLLSGSMRFLGTKDDKANVRRH